MALSSSSCPPLPIATLFFLLSLITAKESLIKIMVSTHAMSEVINSTFEPLGFFENITECLMVMPFQELRLLLAHTSLTISLR